MISFFYFCKWLLACFLMSRLGDDSLPLFLGFVILSHLELIFIDDMDIKNFKHLLKKGSKKMETYILLTIVSLSLFLFVKSCLTSQNIYQEIKRIADERQKERKSQAPSPLCDPDCMLCGGCVVPGSVSSPSSPCPHRVDNGLEIITGEQLAQEIPSETKCPVKEKRSRLLAKKKMEN